MVTIAPPIKSKLSLFEVVFFYALLHAVIWGGEAIKPRAPFLVLLLLVVCIGSNIFHGDSFEKVGFNPKEFWPNAKLVFIVSLPLLLPLYAAAWAHRQDAIWNSWFSLLGYPVWAFVQEYTLLGFVANRLEDIFWTNPRLVPWMNGFLFSLAHLPNPVLMTATFIAGCVFTGVYRRHRHLIPISLAHALFGVGISMAMGGINGVMSVGPGYFTRVGTPLP